MRSRRKPYGSRSGLEGAGLQRRQVLAVSALGIGEKERLPEVCPREIY